MFICLFPGSRVTTDQRKKKKRSENQVNFPPNLRVQKTVDLGFFTRELGLSEMVPFLRGAMRDMVSLGCEGAMRHRLKSVAKRLPPAGPHTDIQCRNRRQHKNRSNRQRRRGDTTNDPNS
jgi:hypothetical protein